MHSGGSSRCRSEQSTGRRSRCARRRSSRPRPDMPPRNSTARSVEEAATGPPPAIGISRRTARLAQCVICANEALRNAAVPWMYITPRRPLADRRSANFNPSRNHAEQISVLADCRPARDLDAPHSSEPRCEPPHILTMTASGNRSIAPTSLWPTFHPRRTNRACPARLSTVTVCSLNRLRGC